MKSTPDQLPVYACAGCWLYNASLDGVPANLCVAACATIRSALAIFGIDAHLEPVQVAVSSRGTETLYGADPPHWRPDGIFNGHTVIVVPAIERFIDVTLQQYREVPASEHGSMPLIARAPTGHGLGNAPLAIDRADHKIIYIPVSGDHDGLWRNPAFAAHAAEFGQAGYQLASATFNMLRGPELMQTALRSPYPRLRQMLHVLGPAQIHGELRSSYRHPATGTILRLTDI